MGRDQKRTVGAGERGFNERLGGWKAWLLPHPHPPGLPRLEQQAAHPRYPREGLGLREP